MTGYAEYKTSSGFQPCEKEGATRRLSRSTCFRFFESAKEYPEEILRVHTMRVAEEHDSSRIVEHRERADAASRTCTPCLEGEPDSRASFEKRGERRCKATVITLPRREMTERESRNTCD